MPQAEALVLTGPMAAELQTVQAPDPGPGDVLVRVEASACSPGTEGRVARGIQEPGQTFPVVPGYAGVGTVIAAGAGAEEWIGRRVCSGGSPGLSVRSLWGGHSSLSCRDTDGLTEVPAGLDSGHAALCKMAAIAHRGVMESEIQPGEKVLVVGLGIIGRFSAQLHHALGAEVHGVDLDEARVAGLRSVGVPATRVASLADARSIFGDEVDVVVDATGAAAITDQVIQLARNVPWGDTEERGSRLLVQGSYPEDMSFNYQEAFLKELRLVLPRDQRPSDLRACLALAAEGRLNLAGLAPDCTPADAPAKFLELVQPGATSLSAVIRWA
ncbi:MAG: hypothetical protein MH204_00360 [Fimbriimonadaceae bacterium]|nr:hypothetical protein [Fimbriimonadaceae bacterium]